MNDHLYSLRKAITSTKYHIRESLEINPVPRVTTKIKFDIKLAKKQIKLVKFNFFYLKGNQKITKLKNLTRKDFTLLTLKSFQGISG